MKYIKAGIITIHKIYNYGSAFQAYALQQVCETMGVEVELIDYIFPNKWHLKKTESVWNINIGTSLNKKKCFSIILKKYLLKCFFGIALFQQHRKIRQFVRRNIHLSKAEYSSPDNLKIDPPKYDIYITGSDQVWNPRYCKGDPSFFLHFAPKNAVKISYAASFGTSSIEDADTVNQYKTLLNKYQKISVREDSGVQLIEKLIGKKAYVVLDPTLLLNATQWNELACSKRLVKEKYVLCYFLNYSFDAFPRVNEFADYVCKCTGLKIVYVARPPQRLLSPHTFFKVGASPSEFLSLIRDSELVLTTSFHGTAFAVNYARPVYSIVEDLNALDSRQISLLNNIGLGHRILSIQDEFPKASELLQCGYEQSTCKLKQLKENSLKYLFDIFVKNE